ncbi:MAG: transglutaminase domain-containing protein [Chloroflexi bacterium]|nr:transglutaminase domain-containing protein [Chloroflexota bacterium]
MPRTLAAEPLTFLLHLSALLVATWSVGLAHWASTPPLVLIMAISTVSALLVLRLQRPLWVKLVLSVTLGAIVIYLSSVAVVDSEGWLAKFADFNSRMGWWWKAVLVTDASTDSLPFAFVLTAATWGVGYATTWALFRHHNVWLAVVPVGAGVLFNLAHLPRSQFLYFFLYLQLALLLIAQTTVAHWVKGLDVRKIEHPRSLGYVFLALAVALALTAVLVAALFPIGSKPARPLRPVSRAIDRYVGLQEEFQRLFGGVKSGSQVPSSLHFFGQVLPLVRPVPDKRTPVAATYAPWFWRVRVYDTYTSKAWKVTDTALRPAPGAATTIQGPDYLDPAEEEFPLGLPIEANLIYDIRLVADIPYFLTAGDVVYVDQPAKVEVAKAPTYRLDMAAPTSGDGLPSEVRAWANTLPGSPEATSLLAQSPGALDTPEVQVIEVVVRDPKSGRRKSIQVDEGETGQRDALQQELKNGELVSGLEVRLRAPYEDFLGLKRQSRGPLYTAAGNLPNASAADLRGANGDYADWMVDRYLQLPETLPQRVRDLAFEITKEADNPYDKAMAIEQYLRHFTHRRRMLQIPFDADGVDYFLFQTKEGNSDYFASAMVVMLRSMGIPARLVLGYGPGAQDERLGSYVIRDSDSHTWPEVYFPGYGWIEFEPSPIYPKGPRSLQTLALAVALGQIDMQAPGEGGSTTEEVAKEQPSDEGGGDDEEELPEDLGGRFPGGRGPFPIPLNYFGAPLGAGGAVFLLALGGLTLAIGLLWATRVFILWNVNDAYQRMGRLAAFLGVGPHPWQTPFEFCRALSIVVPEATRDIRLIGEAFVEGRYGGRKLTLKERYRLLLAWRQLRRTLTIAGLKAEGFPNHVGERA